MKVLFVCFSGCHSEIQELAYALYRKMRLNSGKDRMKCLCISSWEGKNQGYAYESDEVLDRLSEYCKDNGFSCVILEDNMWSRLLAVRLAERLTAICETGISRVWKSNGMIHIKRAVYQANLSEEHTYDSDIPLVMTSRPQGKIRGGLSEQIEMSVMSDLTEPDRALFRIKKDCLTDMWDTKIVIVCGHGIGGKENARKVVEIAGKIGAAVGATRPVVTDGWLPPEHLIGISGAEISPEICIVLGASGSQAFFAGIASSRKIISVNLDENAPVFLKSDIGVVGECMDFVEKLEMNPAGVCKDAIRIRE